MAAKTSTSISTGFAWATLRAFACVAFGATVAIAVNSERLTTKYTGRTVVEQARLCAAALAPSRSGDLCHAVDRLRFEYSDLAGVATLDARGDLKMVCPRSKANSALARAAVQSDGAPVHKRVKGVGGSETLWAAVVNLTNTDEAAARRVVFLFHGDSHENDWLVNATVWGGVIMLVFALAYLWLLCWFESQVVAPLKSLAKMTPRRDVQLAKLPAYKTNGWRETEGIAESLRAVLKNLKNSDEEIKRSEIEAEQLDMARQRRFKNQLRRAEDMAMVDPLTGMRNRRFLEDNLERIYAQNDARDEDMSVVMIDLDEFKQLNDTSGHSAGDELLKFVSEIIRGSIRNTDHGVRYGGDEFLILLPGVSASEARHITNRISKLFLQNSVLVVGNNNVTLSAGVSSIRDNPSANGHELVAKADAALYAAKRDGKNKVMAASTA